jgi:hypothetical protein
MKLVVSSPKFSMEPQSDIVHWNFFASSLYAGIIYCMGGMRFVTPIPSNGQHADVQNLGGL